MNKKANVYSVILITFLLFSVGLIIANFLKEPITDARTNLECSNAASITDGAKLLCLTIDFTMIYFIILVVSIAGGAILDRFVIS
jgi:hypothetical protein